MILWKRRYGKKAGWTGFNYVFLIQYLRFTLTIYPNNING